MESPFRTLKLLFSGICRNTGSDITVMVETNNVRRFYFQKRSHTNTFTVEFRDLFVSSAIKSTLTLDSFGENFSKQLTLGMVFLNTVKTPIQNTPKWNKPPIRNTFAAD